VSEKPTAYYSTSKRKLVNIVDLNSYHLDNAIAKTERTVAAGDESLRPLLDALRQEEARRENPEA
jgi:hypothetical protein